MKLLPVNNANVSLRKHQRQTQVAKMLSKNPYMRPDEIAEKLNFSVGTIRGDIAEINRALHNETLVSAFVHRNRILEEITAKKKLCSEKLAQCRGATAGTRWIEEWTKLVEKECKILGIYSPDRKIIAHIDTAKFTKEEKDAAIKAALLVSGKEDTIDVEPSG